MGKVHSRGQELLRDMEEEIVNVVERLLSANNEIVALTAALQAKTVELRTLQGDSIVEKNNFMTALETQKQFYESFISNIKTELCHSATQLSIPKVKSTNRIPSSTNLPIFKVKLASDISNDQIMEMGSISSAEANSTGIISELISPNSESIETGDETGVLFNETAFESLFLSKLSWETDPSIKSSMNPDEMFNFVLKAANQALESEMFVSKLSSKLIKEKEDQVMIVNEHNKSCPKRLI